MLYNSISKFISKSKIFKTSLRNNTRKSFGMVDKYVNKRKEDNFQKELNFLLSKPVYNLRSFSEKVSFTFTSIIF